MELSPLRKFRDFVCDKYTVRQRKHRERESRRTRTTRRLSLERLESREMLAADIGEIGMLTFEQANSDAWQTVQMSRDYIDPVVIAGPLSSDGSDPAMVRVRNVDAASDTFEVQINEWLYLDGYHTTEAFSYLVVERGSHVLEDGTLLEAGTIQMNLDRDLGQEWFSPSFSTAFSDAPVVFSQLASHNGPDPAVLQQRGISAGGFQLKLREEEKRDNWHTEETVSWLAIEAGPGTNDGNTFLAGTTGQNVTQKFKGISLNDANGNPYFTAPPTFLASMQTTAGSDTANIRYRNFNSSSVQIQIDEEKSKDKEIKHAAENVGYLFWEQLGQDPTILFARPSVDIDIDSNNDGEIDADNSANGTDDSIEETSPRFVHLSNLNGSIPLGSLAGTVQAGDPFEVDGVYGLAEVNMATFVGSLPSSDTSWQLRLSSSDPSQVRVWQKDSQNPNGPMTHLNVDENAVQGVDENVAEWTVADNSYPSSVWIEGITRGQTSLSLVLTQFQTEIARDEVVLAVQPKVTAVNVVVPVTDVKNYGVVDPDGVKNPDGQTDASGNLVTPDFAGGHRFFPGSRTYVVDPANNPSGNNVIRIRAELEGVTDAELEAQIVYFRAFDVDDPSDDSHIDNDDGTGEANDNRGRLQGIDFAAIAADGGVAAPSVGHQNDGFRGYLRPILKDFAADPVNQGKWQPLAHNGEVTEVWAPVLLDSNGNYYAAVDLATSYAPGDNFRVAAAISVPTVKLIQEMEANSVPINTPSTRATEQISVWRNLHIEQDRMAPTEAADKFTTKYNVETYFIANTRKVVIPESVYSSGSWSGGIFRDARGINYPILNEVSDHATGSGRGLTEGPPATIVIELPKDATIDANQFAEGVLMAKVPGENAGDPPEELWISIESHTALDNNDQIFVTPKDFEPADQVERIAFAEEIVLGGELALLVSIDPQRVLDPDLPLDDDGNVGVIYEDDFTNMDLNHPLGISNDEPVGQIDPSDAANTNDRFYNFLQNSVERAKNRFADAYIVPRLDTLDAFDSSDADAESFLRSIPHLTPEESVQLFDEFSGAATGANEGYTVSPAFWAAWVSSAYEPLNSDDGDGEAGTLGVARTTARFAMPYGAFLFVETLRDISTADTVFTDIASGRDNFFAAVATHEIAHLFNVSWASTDTAHLDADFFGQNIMVSDLSEISTEDNFYFHSLDVSSLRNNWQSPATEI